MALAELANTTGNIEGVLSVDTYRPRPLLKTRRCMANTRDFRLHLRSQKYLLMCRQT